MSKGVFRSESVEYAVEYELLEHFRSIYVDEIDGFLNSMFERMRELLGEQEIGCQGLRGTIQRSFRMWSWPKNEPNPSHGAQIYLYEKERSRIISESVLSVGVKPSDSLGPILTSKLRSIRDTFGEDFNATNTPTGGDLFTASVDLDEQNPVESAASHLAELMLKITDVTGYSPETLSPNE